MALNLSMPGKCCSHNRNHHQDKDGPCLICDCRNFEADPCYYGHAEGCEHMVDPEKRCQAFVKRDGVMLRCIEEHDAHGSPSIWHRARNSDPTSPIMYSFSEREAVYPVQSPGAEAADRAEAARDRQVGGNHYAGHKIQVWDIAVEYGLTYIEGSALKYLLRAKSDRVEDLKKARHCIDRLIEVEEEADGVFREDA